MDRNSGQQNFNLRTNVPMKQYDALSDKALFGFLYSKRTRQILQKNGLIRVVRKRNKRRVESETDGTVAQTTVTQREQRNISISSNKFAEALLQQPVQEAPRNFRQMSVSIEQQRQGYSADEDIQDNSSQRKRKSQVVMALNESARISSFLKATRVPPESQIANSAKETDGVYIFSSNTNRATEEAVLDSAHLQTSEDQQTLDVDSADTSAPVAASDLRSHTDDREQSLSNNTVAAANILSQKSAFEGRENYLLCGGNTQSKKSNNSAAVSLQNALSPAKENSSQDRSAHLVQLPRITQQKLNKLNYYTKILGQYQEESQRGQTKTPNPGQNGAVTSNKAYHNSKNMILATYTPAHVYKKASEQQALQLLKEEKRQLEESLWKDRQQLVLAEQGKQGRRAVGASLGAIPKPSSQQAKKSRKKKRKDFLNATVADQASGKEQSIGKSFDQGTAEQNIVPQLQLLPQLLK